jgi:hypothetical protein
MNFRYSKEDTQNHDMDPNAYHVGVQTLYILWYGPRGDKGESVRTARTPLRGSRAKTPTSTPKHQKFKLKVIQLESRLDGVSILQEIYYG